MRIIPINRDLCRKRFFAEFILERSEGFRMTNHRPIKTNVSVFSGESTIETVEKRETVA